LGCGGGRERSCGGAVSGVGGVAGVVIRDWDGTGVDG